MALNELGSQYPNLKIVINSCNNGYKFDENNDNKVGDNELKSNININSAYTTSTNNWGDTLRTARDFNADTGSYIGDLNGDGVVTSSEERLYTMLNYRDSAVLDSYFVKNGGKVKIDNNTSNATK